MFSERLLAITETWPQSVLVFGSERGDSGYSSITPTPHGLGVTFNQWPSNDRKNSSDGPGSFILFTMVPFESFI